mgnify:CR=1 FL=1
MSKPVLFSCFRPIKRAENLRAIYEAYDGPKQLIHSYDPNYHDIVTSGDYDLMVIDDYPACTPGKCIVIDHGIQGGKVVGKDQPGTPYYNSAIPDRITYIIDAGHGTAEITSGCSGVPKGRILPLGMPRTDQYVGKHKGDGHTVLAQKRAYLYVPTFRDKGETPLPDIDWDYIDSTLYDNEVFAIKPHPWYYQYVSKTVITGQYDHIVTIPGDEPSAAYLYDADVVITDYSSIMFDAYLLGKPVVLFEKNPGYLQTRGMYMNYPIQYSSRFAITEEGMINMMRSANSLTQIEKTCINFVADMCDGHACERLCKLIHALNGGELP